MATVKRIGDKAYGIELHYKAKILEETKDWKKETVIY